jgi:putative transcriptional regulator
MEDNDLPGNYIQTARQMMGELVVSEKPWKVLKDWRERFKISQVRLADELGITASVVSDYEVGRRKSPGIAVVKKILFAILKIQFHKERKP